MGCVCVFVCLVSGGTKCVTYYIGYVNSKWCRSVLFLCLNVTKLLEVIQASKCVLSVALSTKCLYRQIAPETTLLGTPNVIILFHNFYIIIQTYHVI